MQGYILKITKSIKEDVIVKILSPNHYYTLYRFYGARHTILYTGRKIDFEIEYHGVYTPKLRNIMHLSRDYETQLDKVYVWQQFCNLLDKHLYDTKDVDSFYFELLDTHVKLLAKQNAKRLVCCMQAHLLEFEGRLYQEDKCFICDALLHDEVAITRGFLLACPSCVVAPICVNKKQIFQFFTTKSLINMQDYDCARLYEILLQGL